jgi:hypothetical protein
MHASCDTANQKHAIIYMQLHPYDNEHHMLLECRHSALAVIRSEHRAVIRSEHRAVIRSEHRAVIRSEHRAVIRSEHRASFDGISDVRKLMAAACKPELAAILGSCMQGILQGLEAGLQGQPNITPAS